MLSVLLGLVVERAFFRSLRGQWLQLVVASVGISLVIQSLGWIAFGIQEKNVPSFFPGCCSWPGVRLPRERLVAAGVGLVLVAGLYLLVYRTKVGLAMRAIEEDEETARMLGINADRVAALGVALGFRPGRAGRRLRGAHLLPEPGHGARGHPDVLPHHHRRAGSGSITGTVLAGLLVGVLQSVGGVIFGAEAAYGLVFVVMIAVLVVRPAGPPRARHDARARGAGRPSWRRSSLLPPLGRALRAPRGHRRS